MKIVAFVPAKGTSDRVKDKNRRILDGEHLFKRKLRQLLACDAIDEVYLDTESDDIAALAADLPVNRLRRPAALATNATDGHELFAWQCAQVDADVYIQVLCTAPFVDAATIDRALDALADTPAADSLVGVRSQTQYTWTGGEPDYGDGRIPNSRDLDPSIVECMSLYIVRRRAGEPTPARRFGADPVLFELSAREAVDLNHPEDLEVAEEMCAGVRAKDTRALQALLPYMSTSSLADLSREFGEHIVLPRTIKPISPGTFLGRAKTLALEPVTDGDWEGIYDALSSYEFVRPGDVIIVSNGVPDRAYFGELNASLALRAGAVGVVIDGVTRDTPAVQAMDIPVYAHGSHCLDIKYEGRVRSMNAPVRIGDVTVCNGDYVMADPDGVAVIPASRWDAFREAAWETADREWGIRRAVARGAPTEELLRSFGAF